MLPEIDLGPVSIQTFGLSLAAAFLCGGVLAARRMAEIGRPTDWAYEGLLAAVVGGVIGAHVDWIIENWAETSQDLLGSFFSGTGLVFFGGLAGGALSALAWARWRGFLGLELLDLAAPCLAIGYAVGRIGCQVAGDGDYGIASDLPWAMPYPNGTVPTLVAVHPTPVYETLVMGFVTLALWRLRGRFAAGVLFSLYLLIAGTERFLIEFIRRNEEVAAGLTLAQIISIALVAAGTAGIVAGRRRRRGAAVFAQGESV